QSVSTNEDVAKAITLTGSDVETSPASLNFVVTVNPAHGTLSGTAPSVTYTPDANYNGTDSFKFTVTDRGDPDDCGTPSASCTAPLTSDPATVSITVNAVNDKPTALASPSSLTINEDAAATTVTLSGQDVETSAANLAFTITAAPAHG